MMLAAGFLLPIIGTFFASLFSSFSCSFFSLKFLVFMCTFAKNGCLFVAAQIAATSHISSSTLSWPKSVLEILKKFRCERNRKQNVEYIF